jgi:membrane fusion protein, heavy metal efflux system
MAASVSVRKHIPSYLELFAGSSRELAHGDSRIGLIFLGVAFGAIAMLTVSTVAPSLRSLPVVVPGPAWMSMPSKTQLLRNDQAASEPNSIMLTQTQIGAVGITVEEARGGALQRSLQVPGTIIPSADRIARIAVKLLGTVAELRKRLGDNVHRGEVVAVIESRDIADAKSEYLAARLAFALQQTLSARAKPLADTRAMAENEYLRIRASFDNARVKLESTRQKLFALGLTEEQISELPDVPVENLRRQELRSPISGSVAERRVDLGALVGREGLESELFVIVDLSEVWVELAIAPRDLASIHEGQAARLSTPDGMTAEATIMFISPLLEKDTRSARVVALLPNKEQYWRPGSFVSAAILMPEEWAAVVVSETALQTVNGEPVVFVRTDAGFEKRPVKLGRRDGKVVEISGGLGDGERVAVANSFILKSELGKAENAE